MTRSFAHLPKVGEREGTAAVDDVLAVRDDREEVVHLLLYQFRWLWHDETLFDSTYEEKAYVEVVLWEGRSRTSSV